MNSVGKFSYKHMNEIIYLQSIDLNNKKMDMIITKTRRTRNCGRCQDYVHIQMRLCSHNGRGASKL